MPSSMSHGSRICFGCETAWPILRSIAPGPFVAAKGRARKLPDRAPHKSELESAIVRVETACAGARIGRPAHVLIASGSRCRTSRACVPHTCGAELVGTSFYQVGEGLFVSSPALTFVHMTMRQRSSVSLLELGCELCGTYQSRRTGVDSAYDVAPLCSVRELGDYIARNPSLKGARKVARALPYLMDSSASSRETKQALLFGLPKRYGGYGLGIPRMNYEVKASPAAQAISGRRSFRCDLCWPERKLDVEYQSKEAHEGEHMRIRDSRRTNALIAMGWTVVCITNDELDSFVATETIARSLGRHLGVRPQARFDDYHARKLKLRRQLGLPMGYA